MQLLTGNKNPVHGRKLCSSCTANFQYTKMEKPALKTVYIKVLLGECCEPWHITVLYKGEKKTELSTRHFCHRHRVIRKGCSGVSFSDVSLPHSP